MLFRLKEPERLHLDIEPTNCHWCTGMLRGLRNIFKGQNCSRHYCSEDCLREGEERAARYAIAGSGLDPKTAALMDRLQRVVDGSVDSSAHIVS